MGISDDIEEALASMLGPDEGLRGVYEKVRKATGGGWNPAAVEEVQETRDLTVCKLCKGWGRREAFICSACHGGGVIRVAGS